MTVTLIAQRERLVSREYGVGHSPSEQERLVLQASILRGWTREYFAAAGLRPGMRVLDVGCGMGDVSLLAAEMVGPTGCVMGIDRELLVLERARARVEATGLAGRIEFIRAGIEDFDDAEPFDAVVGRYVLLYLVDAAAGLRRLAGLLRTGGLLIFHEFDAESPVHPYPEAPLWQQTYRLVAQGLRSIGVAADFGRHLGRTFLDAGLGWPSIRATVPVGGGRGSYMYPWLAETVRTLLPILERASLVTADEVDIDTLASRLEAEAVDLGCQVILGPQFGAWTTKSPTW